MKKIIRRTRKEVYQLWIDALRSGEYKQANSELRGRVYKDEDDDVGTLGFCCLGVLCDLASKDGGPRWYNDNFLGNGSYLPEIISDFMDLGEIEAASFQDNLVDKNDGGLSFKQIANYIEKSVMPKVCAGKA